MKKTNKNKNTHNPTSFPVEGLVEASAFILSSEDMLLFDNALNSLEKANIMLHEVERKMLPSEL